MRYRSLLGCLVISLLLSYPGGARESAREPVYVGGRVCASCHEGPEMGNQYSRWLLSKHARAYAALALPEAKEMARLSGIPIEPQESPICLGCHATGSEAEEWEKDPGFAMEDGVQCEMCHGPGSEYMAEEVMRDPAEAARRGLKKPDEAFCAKCHYVKGSHVAVHKLPQLDLQMALTTIAHPTPDGARPGSLPAVSGGETVDGDDPAYVGVQACAACHRGAGMGYQFSRWRLSPHARAYAILSTPLAAEMAAAEGVEGDPQRAPDCLRCHVTGHGDPGGPFLDSFQPDEGVGCEACHGAGSGYLAEAIMRDPRAAAQAGLKRVDRATCRSCHAGAHGRSFDYDLSSEMIVHPTTVPAAAAEIRYKTPVNLAISPDGAEIYVVCEASDSVVVVEVAGGSKVAEIPVGGQPHDVAFSPDGGRAYVSNRLGDSISVIDVGHHRVIRTVPVGDEPHGLITDASGATLYVLNTADDSISVVDTSSLEETRRLRASRNPWSVALSPDGSRILVTNTLSRIVEFRTPSLSEVTVIATGTNRVDDRIEVPAANLLQGVSWHPSGEYALITLNRTKNLVPMTRILQGWTITNGMGIIWADGRVDQLLLDEPNRHFPDAADVTFTPDGSLALVTSSGSNRVAVVDVEKLVTLVRGATEEERRRIIPNHLGMSASFVVTHLPTGASPRGIVVTPDGGTAYVANALDDSLTRIDLASLSAAGRVDLGGPREITQIRRGELLFHSADITFQRQFSCHSCHPDGHVDGITYDIEPDGIGVNPVDNRTLRGILDTDPFKWEGTNPSLQRQCGPRLAVFFTRIEPFTPDELEALDRYISTIPRPPNRYRPLGAELTPAQRRGKRLFERTHTNDGRLIAEDDRCVTCHFPPMFTDRSQRDVGTRMWLDEQGVFDVPHLNNIYDSAPYLHNGIAPTLEEIWTRYNPDDRHGVTNDMTKDQLNDLIEYLKTL
jgi:YVTN family beta-propeller protein